MAQTNASLTVPLKDLITDLTDFVSRPWVVFFSKIKELLDPLGEEKTQNLLNNQAVAIDLPGCIFNSSFVSQVIVEYLIQRITTGTGGVELITSGVLHLVYKPILNTWAIVTVGTPGPSTSGITFTVTALGQVQYTSTNIAGTPSISRINYRARTLAAKNYNYSLAGGK